MPHCEKVTTETSIHGVLYRSVVLPASSPARGGACDGGRLATPHAPTTRAVRVCAARSEVRWRRKTRSRGEAGERMTILRAYKTELELNHAHVTACKRHAGAARFAYNWALRRKQEAYQATGTSPSAIDLHRALNARKKTELSWMYQVSKCAPQEVLRNLDTACAHCFRR